MIHIGGIQTYSGASKHMGSSTAMGGVQTYRGHANIRVVSKHGVHPNIWGHPNIQGVSKHIGHSNIHGASKCMGAYGHSLSMTKHDFFVLCMYRQHANIIQTYRGMSKHTGGIQTYGWCPNIQGISKHVQGVSKHTGSIQTCEGVQTCRGHPNIWEVSKHAGDIQTYGGVQNTGAIQTYRGHWNIWGCPNIQGSVQTHGGIQTHRGCPNILGHPNIQGPSHKVGFATGFVYWKFYIPAIWHEFHYILRLSPT